MSNQNNRKEKPVITLEDPQYLACKERARGTNVNEQTLLATDYLNHFNEVVMLLEMIPDMPELLEDAHEWTPKSYKDHFKESTIADTELAIEAYDFVPTSYKELFEDSVAKLDSMVINAIDNIEKDIKGGNMDLVRENVSFQSRTVQQAMDVVSGIINGRQGIHQDDVDAMLSDQSEADAVENDQSDIDALFNDQAAVDALFDD